MPPSSPKPPVAALPDVAAGSFAARFVDGARFALDSLGQARRHPRLLRGALLPMLVQLVLWAALAVLTLDWLAGYIDRTAPVTGLLSRLYHVALWAALGLLALVVSALATMFLGGVVCDPLYDALSEATEEITLGHPVDGPRGVAAMVRGVVRELGATAVRLGVWLAGLAVLLVAGMIPGVALVSGPLSMGWTWLFLAIEVFARPQARWAEGGRARLVIVRQHLALSLGFGAGGWLLGLLPFTTPLLVIGGTRLYLALAAHDRVPSTLAPDDKARLRGERAA